MTDMKKHLDSLARFAQRRDRTVQKLEQEELTLIETAKESGASWARIADALGLKSRQRAEQRRRELARNHQPDTEQTDQEDQ